MFGSAKPMQRRNLHRWRAGGSDQSGQWLAHNRQAHALWSGGFRACEQDWREWTEPCWGPKHQQVFARAWQCHVCSYVQLQPRPLPQFEAHDASTSASPSEPPCTGYVSTQSGMFLRYVFSYMLLCLVAMNNLGDQHQPRLQPELQVHDVPTSASSHDTPPVCGLCHICLFSGFEWILFGMLRSCT